MELQGKVALVTGAGSGIGAASALLLASAGARIGVLGHTEDELHTIVGRIRDSGAEAMPLLTDVASAEEMGVVQNRPALGYMGARRAPACESRISTGEVSCAGGGRPPQRQACWG